MSRIPDEGPKLGPECVDIFGSNASQAHKDKAIEMATAALAAMKGA